jgi:hypothetical protein
MFTPALVENAAENNESIFSSLPDDERNALIVAAIVHESMDWDTWGGVTYWDRLLERMRLARIGGPTLQNWFTHLTFAMNLSLTANNRKTAAEIICSDDSPKILMQLIENTEWIITLLRVCVDEKNSNKKLGEKNV